MSKRRIHVLLAACAVGLLVWGLFTPFLWMVDILTGVRRVVAEHQLPNGGKIEVVQCWNGDFYNLNLRHVLQDGTQYLCVIDPDCYRMSRCTIAVETNLGLVSIKAPQSISAFYSWERKELRRNNGVVVEADPVR
jgi:hypothetical protein